tara:strand:- start:341 stop:1504 length:1164 start_codon:yes stop_codon:yes gene_type:complete
MFRVDGKQRQESFDDERSANEFRRRVDAIGGEAAVQVLRLRQANVQYVPTLTEWTRRYLDAESGLLTGIEPGTRDGYAGIAERSFLIMLGDHPVNAITRTDIGRWVEWQEKQPSARRTSQPIAAKTVKNYHALLSSILAAAVDAKLRDDNPAYRTRLSRGTKREAVFLSPDEFRTLLYFIPDYYKTLVHFLAATGCRWGEATAIQWGDLNLTSQTPTVRITRAWKKATGGPVLKHPKSSKARRTVSFYPSLAAELTPKGMSGDLVFVGPMSGRHLWYGRFRTTYWEPAVDKAMDVELCKKLGLQPLSRRPTIHDTRHSHASWLIAAGIPLPYIQARLGHEKITTTVDTYGHLVPDAHEQMASVVAVTLGGAPQPLALEPEEIVLEIL